MRVEEILAVKGDVVHSVAPRASVHEAATVLQDLNIGALVCIDPAGGVIGIISERDIARAVARFGWDCVDMSVSETMTRDVISCRLTDDLDYTRSTPRPEIRQGL